MPLIEDFLSVFLTVSGHVFASEWIRKANIPWSNQEIIVTRQIRFSAAEAIAAGLIDPAVADLVKGAAAKGPSKKKKRGAAKKAGAAEGAKRKRSVSRPAVHPKASVGPAGDGHFFLDENGKIRAAEFQFDLVPVPKERPRVVTNPQTGETFGFTPARTKYFTVEVARVVEHVFGGRRPIEGPVRLEMTFVMQVPKSWPKWKRLAAIEGLIVPTSRPDMDNLEKALLDAFNEKLIDDDAFVVKRLATKIYGEEPMIMVRVDRTGQLDINTNRDAVEELRRIRAESQIS